MASDKPSTPDHIENPPPHRLDETRELTSPGPERYFEPFENLNPDRVPPRPIVVHRRRGEQGLWVIGVDHTYDPNHENYRVLDQRVQKLRGGGAERKRVILHEGRPRRALADLATSIVSQDAGEVGALYWYAKEYKIPIEPTEPEGYPEARGLQKRFDRDAIMLYY